MTEPSIDPLGFNDIGGTEGDESHFPEVFLPDNNDFYLVNCSGNFDFSAGSSSTPQLFQDSGMEFAELGEATNIQGFRGAVEQSSVFNLEPQLDDFDAFHPSLPFQFNGALQTTEYRFEPDAWPQTDFTADSEVPYDAGEFSSASSDSGARSDASRIPVTPPGNVPGPESRGISSNGSSPSNNRVHACSVCKRQLRSGRSLRYQHLGYPTEAT